ncbi:hypothetical protein AURDEDRAFT_177872, partial [Auricularia subglabra TFB-10046 SS5]
GLDTVTVAILRRLRCDARLWSLILAAAVRTASQRASHLRLKGPEIVASHPAQPTGLARAAHPTISYSPSLTISAFASLTAPSSRAGTRDGAAEWSGPRRWSPASGFGMSFLVQRSTGLRGRSPTSLGPSSAAGERRRSVPDPATFPSLTVRTAVHGCC